VCRSTNHRRWNAGSLIIFLPLCQALDLSQELVASTLKDLRTLKSGIEALSILSPSETLEDIPTGDLTYLFVPYVFSEVQGRVKTTTRVDRMNSLIVTKVRVSIRWPFTLKLTSIAILEIYRKLHFIVGELWDHP
jgi:hypothetical protein